MAKYSEIIGRMTLEQKASLITASKGWGNISTGDGNVSAMAVADGTYGVKLVKGLKFYGAPTTRFPSPLNIARTWNLKTGAYAADVIANEARALGVNALTTPEGGVIFGTPSEEQNRHFSEDPYLSGKMLSAYVKGYKHGCVMPIVGINSEIASPLFADETVRREIALQPYEMAVKEGETSALRVTCASFNGEPACESKHLTSIIGTEWQHGGVVFAEDDGKANLSKALALGASMITSAQSSSESQKLAKAMRNYNKLIEEVRSGNVSEDAIMQAISRGDAISEEIVDDALEKLFSAVENYEIGTVEVSEQYTSYPFNHAVMFDERKHAIMAHDAALESIVLAKNDGVLPLDGSKKVAFVGEYVFLPLAACGYKESFVALDNETTEKLIGRVDLDVVGCAMGHAHNASNSDASAMRSEARQLCTDADVAVIYVGNLAEDHEHDGKLPQNQIDLIKELKVNTSAKIVAVYLGRGLVDMSWNDMCDAVILAGDPGQGGTLAILKILSGAYNPSAKLTETVYQSAAVTPDIVGMYGYRMCQAKNIEERYPFGHGLSYTEFEYSDMKVTQEGVEFVITNTGSRAGDEIAQLYVGKDGSAVHIARKELKGFCKVHLEAGESKLVRIAFDSKTFRYYNDVTHSFETEGGTYQIYVASSSRSIRLLDEISVPTSGASIPENKQQIPVGVESQGKVKKKRSSGLKKLIGFVGGFVGFALLGLGYFGLLRDEMFSLFNIRRSDRDVYDFAIIMIVVAGVAGMLVGIISAIRSMIIGRSDRKRNVIFVAPTQTEYKPDRKYPDDWKEILFSEESGYASVFAEAYYDDEPEKKEETQETSKCYVKKHTAFESLSTSLSTVSRSVIKYVSEVGISVNTDELTELFAAIAASRIIAVRSGNFESVVSVLNAVSECIDAKVTSVSAEEDSFKHLLRNGESGMVAAIEKAAASSDKINITVVKCGNTADLSEYFGTLMDYSGSDVTGYDLRLGTNNCITLPSNMWFVAVIPDDVCVDTRNACVVRLHADVSALVDITTAVEQDYENSVIDTYTIGCRAFADMIERQREVSYLDEKYWRKIDKLEERIGADIPFVLSNKTVNAMERFIAICVAAGMEQTDAMDCVLAALALSGIPSKDSAKIGTDEPLTEFMDSVFGADKDDRSREAVKLKGIK